MNQIWSMDFVADALFDGLRLRTLTVVENYSRESLAIDVCQSLKGEDVVNTLNRITAERGSPATIKVDNGSEFISRSWQQNLPVRQGKKPCPTRPLRQKFILIAGTNSEVGSFRQQ